MADNVSGQLYDRFVELSVKVLHKQEIQRR